VIFAVLDVSLAVNLCINCSFFTFILYRAVHLFFFVHVLSYSVTGVYNVYARYIP